MTALVIDLGLDRSPMWLGRAGKSILSEAGALVMGIKLGVPHTLAEMRAVLGCFFISSVCVTPSTFIHPFFFILCFFPTLPSPSPPCSMSLYIPSPLNIFFFSSFLLFFFPSFLFSI